MPIFQYRALSQVGQLVTGDIEAPTLGEVNRRIEYLGLIPIEASLAAGAKPFAGIRRPFASMSRPRAEDVTTFTADLALLLRTGARINDALELLAADADVGRMRTIAAALTTAVLSGESFGEAISRHPLIFPPMYVALVRIGETSGALPSILEALAAERQRAEALMRRLSDALRYPAFLLFAASGVLCFFLVVVLPQFAGVFRDFNAKLDPTLIAFLDLSSFLRSNSQVIAATALATILVGWHTMRREKLRARLLGASARLPVIRSIMEYRRAALFCRNLSLLLSSGVTLPTALRILADTMQATDSFISWSDIVDKVRHGGKLSDAMAANNALPPMAIRTMRLGEETSQLPALSGRIADFYEVKLQRSLDRAVGIIGPLAIILMSVIVGGLIVSVMTALISVDQMAS
jgi:general secretion pathway protein F